MNSVSSSRTLIMRSFSKLATFAAGASQLGFRVGHQMGAVETCMASGIGVGGERASVTKGAMRSLSSPSHSVASRASFSEKVAAAADWRIPKNVPASNVSYAYILKSGAKGGVQGASDELKRRVWVAFDKGVATWYSSLKWYMCHTFSTPRQWGWQSKAKWGAVDTSNVTVPTSA